MTITENSAVSFHYTLTDEQGQEIDSSAGQDPLAYLHGAGNIIPGLEKALEGKSVGDQLNVEVSAEEGYGPVQHELIQDVPRSSFQGVESIEVGMQFEAQTGQGGSVPVTVTAVTDETVTVDGNHPLAGKNLNFDVTIADVREASAEELEHGHIHGPGGHNH
ncbi:peptidylprolyl isomerase [Porticoccaceae bacterium]|jgi:FKBP-type peptidyl-prolyl cis-trans isomerase SlyD|nr:peptidylprolyl isomerase [Porticoccaceae bacterium]